jgi:hypothetical protein
MDRHKLKEGNSIIAIREYDEFTLIAYLHKE